MAKQKGYRFVKGYGGALRVLSSLPDVAEDSEARRLYWTMHGSDPDIRSQKIVDGVWAHVDRAVLAPEGV